MGIFNKKKSFHRNGVPISNAEFSKISMSLIFQQSNFFAEDFLKHISESTLFNKNNDPRPFLLISLAFSKGCYMLALSKRYVKKEEDLKYLSLMVARELTDITYPQGWSWGENHIELYNSWSWKYFKLIKSDFELYSSNPNIWNRPEHIEEVISDILSLYKVELSPDIIVSLKVLEVEISPHFQHFLNVLPDLGLSYK